MLKDIDNPRNFEDEEEQIEGFDPIDRRIRDKHSVKMPRETEDSQIRNLPIYRESELES